MVKEGVEDDLVDLIAGLEIRMRKAEEEVKIVKEMMKEIKEEVVEQGGKGDRGVEKPKRKKHTWEVGDRIILKNSFRYRGNSVNFYGMKGRVTKVSRGWIWFEVHAMCTGEFKLETKWDGGYYRKRHNLKNLEWETDKE